MSQWLVPAANTWKKTCQGNTEGIPTFITAPGESFGPGQTFNNSILVQFDPGVSPTGESGQYDPKSGTMILYGAIDLKHPYNWSQQSVYQFITHEIGPALGLDHDNCAYNSMMQAAPSPGQILSIQPGECLLANYINCDTNPGGDPNCPKQDPRMPPVNNNRTGRIPGICQQLPELCPTDPNQPWIVVWDCVTTSVTTSDCYGFDKPCAALNSATSRSTASPPIVAPITPLSGVLTTWTQDDTVCYPEFIIQQANVDPVPPTLGATGPAVSILTPSEGQAASGIIQVAGAAVQGITGAGSMAFWLDGLPVQLTSFAQGVAAPGACMNATVGTDPSCPNVGFTGNLDTRAVANGNHTLQAVVLDRRPAYPAATVYDRHFTTNNSCFDTTPPTVSVASPASGAVVSGNVLVSVNASDNVAVVQASLYIDGQIVAIWNAQPYTYLWNTTQSGGGAHTLQARAADSCGNTAASHVVTVSVIAPVKLYIDVPAASGSIAGSSFAMTGWATDLFGIVGVSIDLDGLSLPLLSYNYGVSRADVCNAYPGDPHCPFVGWNAAFNSTCYPNGVHTLEVTATDAIGQSGTANWPVSIANSPAPSSAILWIEPELVAGYGPLGSLIVGGNAQGGTACGGVVLWYRDVTEGTGWTIAGYQPVPDSTTGAWLNSIPNANALHQYQAYAVYSGATSAYCNYPGTNAQHWCP